MNRAYIYETAGRDVLIRGHLRGWFRDNGIPALWSPTSRGWFVRRVRLPDLVARLELDGYTVHPRGVRS